MRVLILGGTGYVGAAIRAAFAQKGHQVTVVARHPARDITGVTSVPMDVLTGDLTALLSGIDVVVNAIGIIREQPQDGITFEAMHVTLVERLLAALAAAGVSRLLHLSALGTRPGAASRYHQTKWRAEDRIRQANCRWTIFRPSLVFGGHAPFFELLARLTRLPVAPLPGSGQTLFQPVYRQDIARFLVSVTEDDTTVGQTYELGGPKRYTLTELYDAVARKAGRQPSAKLPIPLSVMGVAAALSRWLPVPITPDQLTMLMEPNITEDRRWEKWIGPLTPFEADWD
jgi:uncharacterized protein YbjT (DUF2867 family)